MQHNSVHFFILTVGHKNVRLFEGNSISLHLVDIKGLPANMKQTLGIDEYANARSVHTVVKAGRVNGVSASQHNASDTDKIMLKEFFRSIDDMLLSFLTQHNYPLILAGLDYVRAMYRSVNSYPHVLLQGISGSHDRTNDQDLHTRALDILHQSSTPS